VLVLDVGQGDAILVLGPDGRAVLFRANSSEQHQQATPTR